MHNRRGKKITNSNVAFFFFINKIVQLSKLNKRHNDFPMSRGT